MTTCQATKDVGPPTELTSSIPSKSPPLLRTNASNLCAILTAGTNLSTPVVTVLPPKSCIAHESTCRLPYELVEMITALLTRDLGTLKACSLTCRSWYTAAVPHLHHTLTLKSSGPDVTRAKLMPLLKLRELCLAPLVKEMRVEQSRDQGSWFAPRTSDCRESCHISAFTNVHTLKIQDVDIYRFISDVKYYFGHFSPTLRSITLSNLHCTPRQLSYFLSFFSNLDDVEILNTFTYAPNPTISDTELVALSTPKLGGRLVLNGSSWVDTWTHLATSCGGLRFRYMDLRKSATCMPVLLEACAETLETLRLYPTQDLIGK